MVDEIVIGEASAWPIVIQFVEIHGRLRLDVREYWWLDENTLKPSRQGISLEVASGQAEEVLLAALALLGQGVAGAEGIKQELEWALLDT